MTLDKLMIGPTRPADFARANLTGVYISFPFCQQKCTYCNFSSGVFPRDLVPAYVDTLIAEIEAAGFPSEPDTLYLGGGTPSLLEIPQLANVLAALPAVNWREATIEASPTTVTREKAAGWATLGINRVSLGVQSFVTREAAATGRKHTPEVVAEEISLLQQEGIENVNIDLIAGLPHQTKRGWRSSLDWVSRLQPPHVSVYMLEVDDESRLGEELRRGGKRYAADDVPSDEEIADFYSAAVDRLEHMSILRYEISNFAKPGYESAHNLKYWNMETYLGFGSDAHSFDGKKRWANASSPVEYVERRRGGGSARIQVSEVDENRRIEDRLMTGLRQMAGIRFSPNEFAAYERQLEAMAANGWLELTRDNTWRLTPAGVMFSNEVFQQFLRD